ncbi:unnamed protein product [Polarella glacialis]|uniref:Amino acid transporter transmembrane domain-containing protein n=1 Tax=Polarella glacialis TaxID=89957 RepID=A0A813DI70_POLGL|nr:unnamed protein product [Polarella glacialis]
MPVRKYDYAEADSDEELCSDMLKEEEGAGHTVPVPKVQGGGAPSPSFRQSLQERGGRPAAADHEGSGLADMPMVAGDGPQGAAENEATLNLLNCLLGNSLLALPWAFARVGMALGVLLLVLGSILSRYTLHLLLKHVDTIDGGSYPQIERLTYGLGGEVAVLSVYLMHSSGALCA